MLPRIPLTKRVADFWKFSQVCRDLAHWHLNYETLEPYPLEELDTGLKFNPSTHHLVQRMTFGRKDKQIDKMTIIYNSHLTLSGVPLETAGRPESAGPRWPGCNHDRGAKNGAQSPR
jgi:predicted helicase